MWREPLVRTGTHTVSHEFKELGGTITLLQQFSEGDHRSTSAVAVTMSSVASADAEGERTKTLIGPQSAGKQCVFISSTADLGGDGSDVESGARRLVAAAKRIRYAEHRSKHVAWWSAFWSRTFVDLTSPDGSAEFLQRVRTLHLYYMASTSRGELPPKWNGSLFAVDGDTRRWGAQFWLWTTEMLYFPLYAADAVDLTEPFFSMYLAQLPRCEAAARQRWNAKGVFVPEVAPFDGTRVLPDNLTEEFRALCSGSGDSMSLSQEALAFGRYDLSLQVFCRKSPMAAGRYSWVSHLVSSGAELAIQAWWRYRYTGATRWLERAWPLLCGTAEFYRSLARRGADGRYHFAGTNVHEDFWGARDGIMDLAAIRGAVPLAVRASEILGLDEDLREAWRELLVDLAPYPMGSNPEAKALGGAVLSDDVWAAGHRGEVDGQHNPEDTWLTPVFPFEAWTMETGDPEADRIVRKLVDLAPRMRKILSGEQCNTAIRTPIAAARAGLADRLPVMLDAYWKSFPALRNGMSLFEYPTAHSIEIPGCITLVLQEMLLQSVSPSPGDPEIISVFPAWPRTWSASFSLLARGGFMVRSTIAEGRIALIEIESRLGEEVRIRNPWSEVPRVTTAGGAVIAVRQGSGIVSFDTRSGESYLLAPITGAPSQLRLPVSAYEAVESRETLYDGV